MARSWQKLTRTIITVFAITVIKQHLIIKRQTVFLDFNADVTVSTLTVSDTLCCRFRTSRVEMDRVLFRPWVINKAVTSLAEY